MHGPQCYKNSMAHIFINTLFFKSTRETFWASTKTVSLLNSLFTSEMHVRIYNARHIGRDARFLFLGTWQDGSVRTSRRQWSQAYRCSAMTLYYLPEFLYNCVTRSVSYKFVIAIYLVCISNSGNVKYFMKLYLNRSAIELFHSVTFVCLAKENTQLHVFLFSWFKLSFIHRTDVTVIPM
jgi:hypothetical protein